MASSIVASAAVGAASLGWLPGWLPGWLRVGASSLLRRASAFASERVPVAGALGGSCYAKSGGHQARRVILA